MALSSGEAEYDTALKGASVVLGFQSMCADLGNTVSIEIFTDSAVARGMIGRRGLGEVRHLDVGYLWLQDLVADKRTLVSKAKGTENLADMGTKHLSLQDIDTCIELINCYVEVGRSPAVPSITK